MDYSSERLNKKNNAKCIFCGLKKNLFVEKACENEICSSCKHLYEEYDYATNFYFSKLQNCEFCSEEATILCKSDIGDRVVCRSHFNKKHEEIKIKSAETLICSVIPQEKKFLLLQIQARIYFLNQISNTISITTTKIISQLTKVSQDTIKKCLIEIKKFIKVKNSLNQTEKISIKDYFTLKNPLFSSYTVLEPRFQSALNILKKKISFSSIFENLQDSKYLYFSNEKSLLAVINIRNKSFDTFKTDNNLKIGLKGQIVKIGPNEFFLFGGLGSKPVTEAYSLDLAENETKVLKNAPFSINSGGCIFYKKQVFVFTGCSPGLKFNLKYQVWNQISQFPELFSLGISQVLNNKILVTGNGTGKLLAYNEESDTFNSFLIVEKGLKLFFKDLLLINGKGVYKIKPSNEIVLMRAGLDLGIENINNSFTAIHNGKLYVLGDRKLTNFNYQTFEIKYSAL